MRAAVFLDRDGVLNEVRFDGEIAASPRSVGELKIRPETGPLLEALREAGFLLIVVSNQPDVGRGIMSVEMAESINDSLASQLPIDAVFYCPHGAKDGCSCRKPLPGMLFDAAERYDIDFAESWIIGDRWVDIEAGRTAGVGTVLLDRPYSWSPTNAGTAPDDLAPDMRVADLEAAVEGILAHSLPRRRQRAGRQGGSAGPAVDGQ